VSPTSSTLNIIWPCGLFEGKGVSTSRVSPPGPLSVSFGHVGCWKAPVSGRMARDALVTLTVVKNSGKRGEVAASAGGGWLELTVSMYEMYATPTSAANSAAVSSAGPSGSS
jgi:hypothetical protein